MNLEPIVRGRLALTLLVGFVSSGCYAHAGGYSGYAAVFEPGEESQTVIGRDCSFHIGGLVWRDLAVRQAARNAVDGTGDAVALAHVTSRLVYPAPFKVCVEVEGIPVARQALTAAERAPHIPPAPGIEEQVAVGRSSLALD